MKTGAMNRWWLRGAMSLLAVGLISCASQEEQAAERTMEPSETYGETTTGGSDTLGAGTGSDTLGSDTMTGTGNTGGLMGDAGTPSEKTAEKSAEKTAESGAKSASRAAMHEKMAEVHRKLGECLEEGRSEDECRREHMTEMCPQGPENCPMASDMDNMMEHMGQTGQTQGTTGEGMGE